jgi:hypothetical protein
MVGMVRLGITHGGTVVQVGGALVGTEVGMADLGTIVIFGLTGWISETE